MSVEKSHEKGQAASVGSDAWLGGLVGRSLPSVKFGAWIVDEVRGGIDGRSRLVSANLKWDQWISTRTLVAALDEMSSPNDRNEPRHE